MSILISVITLTVQLAIAAVAFLVSISVLLTIVWLGMNAVRRARGVAPLPLDDFLRKCGMEPAPPGWPFKRPRP